MKKVFLITFLFLSYIINVEAQIDPINSPYLEMGAYTVESDSDMTAISVPMLFYYPQTVGTYPVFMFQLGANGIGSSVINRHTYDLFMKHLASYGFVVIVIDDSQAGFPTGTTFKAAHTWYKSKCLDNNHWLSSYADVNKFVVGGHSNGGVNASAILVDRPSEIHGIVFLDSYPSPGTFGIGVHDVSGYTGKELTMAADENVPDTYKGGYELFTSATCKTYINVAGLDHGGFGDYVLASQPVGSIGRDNATATIRHYLVSWFLSEFYDNSVAAQNLATTALQPNTTKEFLNDCGMVSIIESVSDNTSIYPNPVSDFLSIKSDTPINNIIIYNASGQEVYNNDILQINDVIDIRNLPCGLYLLKYSESISGSVFSKKIIKK